MLLLTLARTHILHTPSVRELQNVFCIGFEIQIQSHLPYFHNIESMSRVKEPEPQLLEEIVKKQLTIAQQAIDEAAHQIGGLEGLITAQEALDKAVIKFEELAKKHASYRAQLIQAKDSLEWHQRQLAIHCNTQTPIDF